MPWVTCGWVKGVPAKEIYFLAEINFSKQKQNYRFYLFDKSWDLSDTHVILWYKVLFNDQARYFF